MAREDKLLWLRSGGYILTVRAATFEAYGAMGTVVSALHIFTHLIHKNHPRGRDCCPLYRGSKQQRADRCVPTGGGSWADSGRRAPEPVSEPPWHTYHSPSSRGFWERIWDWRGA